MTETPTPYPPGARVYARAAEWIVSQCAPVQGGYKVTAVGASEFVRDETSVFFTGIEPVELLRPEDTELESDRSPGFATSRLYLEAVLRRTPLPQTEKGLALPGRFLLDSLPYQLRPAELALKGLRPRILLADVVGLGKTLEIGLILAELIRRGRGERILVVTPQQVLEQFQHELWTRFSIPLIRLDSIGLERIQQDIPAGRNPFLYYKRIIISVDTLKNEGRYGQHLDEMDWDAVVIDESHNLIGEASLRNRLAKRLARKADALLLASATPHNGKAESFAELIRMLDPAAIVDKTHYSAKEIEHLYIRRTKVSPEVRDQMGTRWPDRGPSVPVPCEATPAEERIFEELTEVWLAGERREGGPVVDARNRLFPYTLLKSFLSSHKALAATVGNRLKNATEPREIEALESLKTLTAKMTDDDSAKLDALVTQLRRLGVAARSQTRVVVFSESVPTLKWLKEVVPARLGLPDDAVAIMHGGFSDTEQQRIVEEFSLADSKVRLLFTGDVASEGVNLHRECHDLIHYDVPWSLIRIEQRNGRIDRYGQKHAPQFKALILTSDVEGAKDDRTVALKLLEKEETAHRAFGTAEAVTGEYTPVQEERRLIQDLLDGKSVEESLEDSAPDFLADLFGSVGADPAQPDPLLADVPALFADTRAFVDEAVRSLRLLPDLEDDGEMLSFTPPPDLVHRLSVLPKAYLRAHKLDERMRVTFDTELAGKKLAEARRTKTMWPDIAYLSDLHPMVEWLTDKVLVRLGRQKAPVIVAENVSEPVFLIQGVYSNKLGRPTVVEWMAVSGDPPAVQDASMLEVLKAAKVGPGMLNKALPLDVEPLQRRLVPAVTAARAHLEGRRVGYDAEISELLEPFRSGVEIWEQRTLDGARTQTQTKEAKDTAEEQRRLIDQMETTGEPLLRVLAVLVGENA
ncbi:DEAD/DEAH box helicase [Actinocorallia sp. B10E7]|uniref:DEAD/DEAH box helicase n=1 Tax=Actinocorallia sp. B10E7 TaxID=3153558 RepID=UPI00325E1F59